MKRISIISILIFILLASASKAGETTETKKSEENTDTVNYTIDAEKLMFTEYDSVLMFPAYELYCQWDTVTIHPYKFEISSVNDTSYIPLIDEYNCGYTMPFPGEISSDFGMRRNRPHYGVDINLETGDTVVSAFAGKVRIAKRNKSYGNVVIIRHSNGLETFYAHLSKLSVKVGQVVEPGQLIGLGGNTGHSYGSHLHFEVRYKGFPINPNELISFDMNELRSDTLCLDKKSFKLVREVKSTKYHTVRKGDNLSAIARRYGTSVPKLCKLNKIRSTTTLRIGMRLRYS